LVLYVQSKGPAHAMVYDPVKKIVYEVNHPKGENDEEVNGFWNWVNYAGPKSTAYQWERNNKEEWTDLVEREEGNMYALAPVYVPNPEGATEWFQSQTGKTFDYNVYSNNCATYSLNGLKAGGAYIYIYIYIYIYKRFGTK